MRGGRAKQSEVGLEIETISFNRFPQNKDD